MWVRSSPQASPAAAHSRGSGGHPRGSWERLLLCQEGVILNYPSTPALPFCLVPTESTLVPPPPTLMSWARWLRQHVSVPTGTHRRASGSPRSHVHVLVLDLARVVLGEFRLLGWFQGEPHAGGGSGLAMELLLGLIG